MRPGESGDGMNSQVVLRVGTDVAPDRVPGLSDMVCQTDPHLFGFLFGGDSALWRRLFQQEWTADCGLHRGADTIVATTADMAVLGLLNAFPGHEVDSRAEASFGRYLNALDGPAAAQLSEAAEQMAWLFPPVRLAHFLSSTSSWRKPRAAGGWGRCCWTRQRHRPVVWALLRFTLMSMSEIRPWISTAATVSALWSRPVLPAMGPPPSRRISGWSGRFPTDLHRLQAINPAMLGS